MATAGRIAREIIEKAGAEIARMVLLDLWTRLTKYTPVDTGRARAGWILAVGAPSSDAPAPGHYGPPEPPAFEVNLGDTTFITNNVPYIEALDNGHSEQRPEGFTDRAVLETTRKYSA